MGKPQTMAENVRQLRGYRIAEEPDDVKRPYRIWDAKGKAEVRWANFLNLRHAHLRALSEAAWSKNETTFEVFDVRTGSLRGQYIRKGSSISFWRSHHPIEDE
jgi:hypothetical protein